MERASVVDSIGTPVDLACDRETLDHDARAIHADLLRRLSQHRQATTELVDGYAFTFPPRSELLADLAAWVALERRCCPFLRFAISIDAASTVRALWFTRRTRVVIPPTFERFPVGLPLATNAVLAPSQMVGGRDQRQRLLDPD